MKIKKTFLAILAVLTLFASSASTAVSAFTSVEANAATQHKNVKKHKKAKKTTKKSKKTTKKSKKKATKKHSKKKVTKKKKVAKKTSKKKVAKKKKAPKKVAKKKPVKKVAKKKVVTHFTASHFTAPQATPSNPTIDINPTGNQVIRAQYTNKQYRAFDNVLISDHSTDSQNPHRIVLKGITYYNLVNAGDYKTAITLSLMVYNDDDSEQEFFSDYDSQTYISSNNVDKKLYPAWEYNAADIPAGSQQPTDITLVGTDDSTAADFSSFTFNYETTGVNNPIAVNLNF
ncbi:hypothetical protein AKUA2003_00410 [Apilactobacillus kunkeei]|nr:hypothetical protein AKUA2003_00410 [Apilactobacillus kunkeei]CAI2550232.1 hypothetical protein AKUA1001_00410 [Apilactobacillus kunkeei]CAI2800938.1 hypothetical protein AKUA2002_00410 [Apilactobacillus kunkeei]